MRFIEVSEYSKEQFYRLTGVKREVFELMEEVVSASRSGRGRRPTLSVADQLLLTLCYWREYRSQFHVASSFGVSEATVCRTVKKVEGALLKDQRFHLPGKKALHDGSLDLTVIVVDASEQRIERPQKNSVVSTPARRNAILRKDRS
jgi:hypothetical protein